MFKKLVDKQMQQESCSKKRTSAVLNDNSTNENDNIGSGTQYEIRPRCIFSALKVKF
jgi:hypothetical protein